MTSIDSSLSSLFHPDCVAVVGASRDSASVGTSILRNILDSGFSGKVIPINPNADEILGLPVVRDISEVKYPVDLAIISVPAAIVPLILEKGKGIIKNAVIITSGFAEIGPEGKVLEEKITSLAKTANIRIVGPNTLGVILPHENLNASFAKTKAVKGSIALITQSGALGSSFLDIAQSRNIGLSAFVSIGNMSDVSITELVTHFADDPQTNMIALYLESLSGAPSFISAVKKAQKNGKRVIVLKAGKTKKGQVASQTHTGAFSADKRLYEGMFRQSHLIEALDCQHFISLLSLADTIKDSSLPLVIVTNAGGPGILATDAAEILHLPLAETTPFPNPYDIHGDATSVTFDAGLKTVEKNYPGHPILAIVTPQTTTNSEEIAQVFVEAAKRGICPIVVSFIGDASFFKAKTLILNASIPSISYPELAIQSIASLTKKTDRIDISPSVKPKTHITEKAIQTGEALESLREAGIAIAKFGIATTHQDIASILETVKASSYALKIISPDISHKSDVGGVILNVSPTDVPAAFQRMWATVQTKAPNAHITGICIMEMVNEEYSVELFLGMKRDPHLGTALFLGVGGVYTNIIADVQTRFMPYDKDDILEMLTSLTFYPVLAGVRGKKPLAINKIVDIALLFQKYMEKHPEIQEFDANPIVLSETDAIVIDARMTSGS
jgi:acyl-CoA synthetase (NDP forming)